MSTSSFAGKWIPKEFMEASQIGGVYTLAAYAVMIVVFFCELSSFMIPSSPSSMVRLDERDSDLLQINFDVDLYDIECRNVKVTCISQSNDEPLSILSQDFWLRSIDAKGRTFGMATKQNVDLDEDGEHQRTMEKLIKEDGKAELDADWSTSHDGFKHKSFDHVIQAHDFTFINFFAGWCSHCQHFAPAWADLADKINGNATANREPQTYPDRDGVRRSVRLIKMNCVDFKDLCNEKGIDAYPMLRLYKADGTFSLFEGKRDPGELTRWLERTVKMKSYGWASSHEAFERGCNAKGRIQIPRVPAHLEFQAGGGDQNLNPSMTNVSHLVKHLSFSDPDDGKFHRNKRGWTGLPREFENSLNPLDGRNYVTKNYHEAWIHDFKILSIVNVGGQVTYQFTHQHRLSRLDVQTIPQAQFHFDIEPFSIFLRRDEKKWYDFITSMLAILGGIYAMMRFTTNVSLVVFASSFRGSNGRAKEGILGS